MKNTIHILFTMVPSPTVSYEIVPHIVFISLQPFENIIFLMILLIHLKNIYWCANRRVTVAISHTSVSL